MSGRGDEGVGVRTLTYCIVPRELAAKLHDPLRRFYADDPSVEVVVERRFGDRRATPERRTAKSGPPGDERRRIRSGEGRRAGERRAVVASVDQLPLPRKAQAYADRLVFVERIEPSGQRLEDFDTARLVSRFQAGDRDAFSDLYLRYFDRVYAYLRIALRDEHAAEDAAQHVFTQVFEALPRYERRRQPFRAWLFVIARNHAFTQMQRRGRLDVVDPQEIDRRRERRESEDLDLRALNWISDRDLMLFVERLPLAQRQVLVLRYLFDLNTEEIASLLSRSASDVRTLDYRARRFLRQRLAALGRDSSSGGLIRMRRWGKPAPVLRSRRFALIARPR
jgi:RNA polymerase sigma-70 factor (ECF subfamily)